MKRKYGIGINRPLTARPLEFGRPMSIGKPISLGKPLYLHKKVSWMQPTKTKKDLTYPEARNRYDLSPRGDVDKDGRLNYMDCRPYDPMRQGIFGDIATGIKKRVVGEEPRQASLDEFGREETDPSKVRLTEKEKVDYEGLAEERRKKKKGIQWISRDEVEKGIAAKAFGGMGQDAGMGEQPSRLRAGARKVVSGAAERVGDIGERVSQTRQYKKALKGGIEETAALQWYIVVKIRNDKWYQWGPYDTKTEANNALISKKSELGSATIEKFLLSQNPNEALGRNAEKKIEHISGRVGAYQAETGMDYMRAKKRIKKGLEVDEGAIGELAKGFTKVDTGPPASRDWYRPERMTQHKKRVKSSSSDDVFTKGFRRALGIRTSNERSVKGGITFGNPERKRLGSSALQIDEPAESGIEEEPGYSEEYRPTVEDDTRSFTETTRTIYTPQGKMEHTFRKYKPFKPKMAQLGGRRLGN